MAKILIDVPDEVYERLYTINPMDIADQITIDMAIKHGIVLDELTNGEVIQKVFRVSDTSEGMITMYAYTRDNSLLTTEIAWWNAKWG